FSNGHLGVAVVPEPGVLWLAGVGALFVLRRR
ncbi:MAG: PEP-CTERM sorting domain-containing protein, partial [bacterium]|nr:PEP-CTERM sorting domain-containing protein [bacterium]